MISLFLVTPHWSVAYLPVSGAGSSHTSPRYDHFLSMSPLHGTCRILLWRISATYRVTCWPVSPSGCSLFRTRVQSSPCWTSRGYTGPCSEAQMPDVPDKVKSSQNVTGLGSWINMDSETQRSAHSPEKKGLRKLCSSLSTPALFQSVTALRKPGTGSHSPAVN